ncbi:terpenoid cyclases/protein prenyltransferase alpha-alpha toroid [Delphinella strobiligena]|nr:terpenoid cyclases/protein prenyltransferase alpha-alpha toroid [Delphinella strobiligena]
MGAKLKYNDVPHLFAHPSLLHDTLVTETSEKHDKVMRTVLDILTNTKGAQEIHDPNSYNLPRLQREKHIKFLRGVLGNYPPPFQVMDASRPWLLYWALAGLSFLGVDVSLYKDRTIQTFTPLQNPDGGFGGGDGQMSHCAAGYAATLSLAMVGALDMIDRRSMWRWLGSVKQADGSFTMAVGGEKDIRGAYCGMTIHTLLNLPLDLPSSSPARVAGLASFTDKLGEWISLCQTYEGGIGGAPTNEAHGAYAFCGLACLCLLDAPHRSLPTYLDLPRLISCLSSLQSAPEGSFAGRTNKLVDACYSHWVGSCWALVEAALETSNISSHSNARSSSLWSRQGLVRYSLSCSQAKKGGLRDKPGTRPDGYHTCYSLAGLSAAQNKYIYISPPSTAEEEKATTGLTAAFNWRAEAPTPAEMKDLCLDESDLVGFVHPVFVLPMGAVESARRQFEDKIGF